MPGISAAALVLTSDHASPRGLLRAVMLIAGWGFAFTGLYAWDRRPGNNIGPTDDRGRVHLVLPGGLQRSQQRVVFAIGVIGSTLPFAILIHLLVSFPSGRLKTRLQHRRGQPRLPRDRALQLVWALFTDPDEQSDCGNCPENPILIGGAEGVAEADQRGSGPLRTVAAIAIAIGLLYRTGGAARIPSGGC